ncbi:LytR/AlgR family response regulator transcription factor [Spirosoma sp. KUDC1026]|uniref:LytR/AlgR family response regulator transcription factor n=1 Tax=Spirosoma sp. KUDC1026 TaxID=2745947 RepID=UPI00159BB750|nr:response regulator [Spirosoma sp. KUDC1026]QKZ14617.1 response regulator [Spirosoma sp. KUDC1026]
MITESHFLNVLIVEDELVTAMDIQETLENAGHTVVAIADTSQDAVNAFKDYHPDLVMIDIQLGEQEPKGGINAVRAMQAIRPVPIIYLTANSEQAMIKMARKTLPAAYLLKPFRPDELIIQVELAYHTFAANQPRQPAGTTPQELFLHIDQGYEKILPRDVLYIMADGVYSKLFLVNRDKPRHVSMNLSHLAEYFTGNSFYRLSRSYLINLDHLERLERNSIYMVNDKTPIPVPADSRKELMNKLTIVRTKKKE